MMISISDNCDSKGRQNSQSIDRETRDGIVSLKRRITSGEQPQFTVIFLEDQDETERVLNAHAIQATRILRTGENHGHGPRVRQAVTNKSCHVPVLSGTKITHKNISPVPAAVGRAEPIISSFLRSALTL